MEIEGSPSAARPGPGADDVCGRFSLGVDTDRLIVDFGIASVTADIRPRFNIAPTQPVAAVVRRGEDLRLGLLRWGLVPSWADDLRVGSRMINARSESAHRKPAFRDALRERRCLIPADGFYEWRREADGRRTPMHIRLPDGSPFAFAGLWERWAPAAGPPVYSCAILTTAASPALRAIHDRMPVLLPAAARSVWLDPSSPIERILPLMRPFDEPLSFFPVSERVNSPAHDDPGLVEPVDPPGNILDQIV